MVRGLKPIIALIFIATFLSCGSSKQFFTTTDSRSVTVSSLESEKKLLLHLEMPDLAPADFYEDAIVKIELFKREGYVLYYEDWQLESLNDTDLRKLKKIMGVLPSMDAYAKHFDDKIAEGFLPNDIEYLLMIENYEDYPIEMKPTEFLAHYEKTYGKINLSDTEKTLDINEKWTSCLPRKQYEVIANDWTNLLTSQKINTSEHDRIMLIYNTKHKDQLLAWLQKIDASWQLIKQ